MYCIVYCALCSMHCVCACCDDVLCSNQNRYVSEILSARIVALLTWTPTVATTLCTYIRQHRATYQYSNTRINKLSILHTTKRQHKTSLLSFDRCCCLDLHMIDVGSRGWFHFPTWHQYTTIVCHSAHQHVHANSVYHVTWTCYRTRKRDQHREEYNWARVCRCSMWHVPSMQATCLCVCVLCFCLRMLSHIHTTMRRLVFHVKQPFITSHTRTMCKW